MMGKPKYNPPIRCAECGKDLSKAYNCKWCDCTLCFDCWNAHEDECGDPGEEDHDEEDEE